MCELLNGYKSRICRVWTFSPNGGQRNFQEENEKKTKDWQKKFPAL
jgi:hypothetical protein